MVEWSFVSRAMVHYDGTSYCTHKYLVRLLYGIARSMIEVGFKTSLELSYVV